MTKNMKNSTAPMRIVIREQQLTAFTAALLDAGGVSALALMLKAGLYWRKIACPYYEVWAAAAVLAVLLVTFLLRLDRRKNVAVRLDRRYATGSRLECAVELYRSHHPLRQAQWDECREFFRAHPVSPRFYRLAVPAVLLAAVWTPLVLTPRHQPPPPAVVQQVKPKAPAAAKPAPPAEPEDPAELALTAPGSEIRAKPMDEIAFEGNAESQSGFSEITVQILVNAQLKKVIKLSPETLKKAGKLTLAGEFGLDELEVQPFDLVSYHLRGYTVRDAARRKPVVSPPQFIEVRPFREDAFLLTAGPNGAASKALNMIVKLLQAQIELNKSTFVASSAVGRVKCRALAQELGNVALEQGDVYLETADFISGLDPAKISANSYYAVKQAAQHMHTAREQLDTITKNVTGRAAAEENHP